MTFREKCAQWSQSRRFVKTTAMMIILCSIVLGIETAYAGSTMNVWFIAIDTIFVAYFTFEITIRFLSERYWLHFFRLFRFVKEKSEDGNPIKVLKIEENGFWNWFDLIVVFVSIVGSLLHFLDHPELLAITRLFRIFRVLRLFEISEKLKIVEKKILSIIPTVLSFAMLLFILIYIYVIIGMHLFEFQTNEKADFSSIWGSFLALFQIMTLDGWSDVMNALNPNQMVVPLWFGKLYFVSFVILTAIITFNVFIAILTSQVEDRLKEDLERHEQEISKTAHQESAQIEQDLKTAMDLLLQEIKELKNEVRSLKK